MLYHYTDNMTASEIVQAAIRATPMLVYRDMFARGEPFETPPRGLHREPAVANDH